MLINSLEKMEKIVENNSSLNWNGWDVVEMTADPVADLKPNALFVNGKWFKTKTYSIGEQGWSIPAKFIG